jgi:formate dehydrogenase subunit delta
MSAPAPGQRTIDGLVHKANLIARYFASQPRADAVVEAADHIHKFWEPRMRAQAYAWLDAGGGGLEPVARQALERLRLEKPPPSS